MRKASASFKNLFIGSRAMLGRFTFSGGAENARIVSEGAGLGLAITKKILELHGSKIDVHSRLNAGTTLTFELPAYSS